MSIWDPMKLSAKEVEEIEEIGRKAGARAIKENRKTVITDEQYKARDKLGLSTDRLIPLSKIMRRLGSKWTKI